MGAPVFGTLGALFGLFVWWARSANDVRLPPLSHPAPPLTNIARSYIKPSAFHGEEVRSRVDPLTNLTRRGDLPYFEGWYIKVTDDSGKTTAFIPGAFYGSKEATAFVLTLEDNGRATKFSYPLTDFRAEEVSDRFEVSVGPNTFSSQGMHVSLPEVAEGSLSFQGATPWPVTLLEPGVMGWFAWLPWMECRHGVPSLAHRVEGKLSTRRGAVQTFSSTPGYIEKDRGRQFPSHWIWIQSNAFPDSEQDVSLTGSIARIPYLGFSFPGHVSKRKPRSKCKFIQKTSPHPSPPVQLTPLLVLVRFHTCTCRSLG